MLKTVFFLFFSITTHLFARDCLRNASNQELMNEVEFRLYDREKKAVKINFKTSCRFSNSMASVKFTNLREGLKRCRILSRTINIGPNDMIYVHNEESNSCSNYGSGDFLNICTRAITNNEP